MSINGVNGSFFNPYANGVNSTRNSSVTGTGSPQQQTNTQAPAAQTNSVAEAIKNDASSRAAQLNSSQAPDGVDQDLWSVLSKDERAFFMKAGAMGPLTYGRASTSQAATPAPMMRGGRLDIKA